MSVIRLFSIVLAAVVLVCVAVSAQAHTASVVVGGAAGESAASLELAPRKLAGSFRFKFPKKSIPKNADYVDVRFDFAKAAKGEDGYFVLGDGRLGTFSADEGFLRERRNPMPIFGMKTPRGTFVAIVKKLKYEFEMCVDCINGVYEVYPRFLVSKAEMGFDPYEDILIDVYFFDSPDAGYSEMGRAYRKYQLDRGEVKPLSERVKTNPQLAYTADTIFVRVKHGGKPIVPIDRQTPENEPKVGVAYDFKRFKDIMAQMKDFGIEKAEICSVGATAGGFDGRYPDLFPIEPAFGGEEQLRKAVDFAHSIGYQIVEHVCNNDFYQIATRFDERDLSRRADGSLRSSGILAGGRHYDPCYKQVFEKYIPDDYKGLSAIGFKGTHHIDVTSCITPPYCADKNHPCNRKQVAEYMNKIGFEARRVFGGFGSEGPCDHVAASLDYALYASAYPSWVGRAHPLVERVVPLWQIVYHGIIISNPFYYTIDYNIDGKRAFSPYDFVTDIPLRRLKLAEFGGRPTFYFQPYTPQNIAKIKEAYDEYQPLKYLQYMFMDYHGELAKDVFLTRYSDGSEIVCNYSDKKFPYKGLDISPMDYKLFKSAK